MERRTTKKRSTTKKAPREVRLPGYTSAKRMRDMLFSFWLPDEGDSGVSEKALEALIEKPSRNNAAPVIHDQIRHWFSIATVDDPGEWLRDRKVYGVAKKFGYTEKLKELRKEARGR